MSELIAIDPSRPDGRSVGLIADRIRSGGVVVAPTDTRYGLLVRADDQSVLERMMQVKRRDSAQPVALLLRDRTQIGAIAQETALSRRLADRLLPGPVTLVLRTATNWPPPRVVNGLVGIRCVDVPLIRDLLLGLSFPLSATSANRSGRPDGDRVAEIRNELGDEVDLYVDGGPLIGPASTVIDCTGDKPRILREGALTLEEIQKAAEE
jgi:L-threonylcarbamoyladenylate synthase